MNLYNVSGESLRCYVCSSPPTNACADPVDTSALQPFECVYSRLNQSASAAPAAVGSVIRTSDIPNGKAWNYVCLKYSYTGGNF
jgi:hypothetical protein